MEPDFVWSNGRDMRVDIPLASTWSPTGPQRLVVSTNGFVAPASPQRRVRFSVNGGPEQAFTFDLAHTSHDFVEVLDGERLAKAGAVHIRLTVESAASPAEAGLGGDTRRLGLALKTITVAPGS